MTVLADDDTLHLRTEILVSEEVWECGRSQRKEICGTLLSTPEGNGRPNTATATVLGSFCRCYTPQFPLLTSSFPLPLYRLCLPSLLKESFHGKVIGPRCHCQAWFRIYSLIHSALSPHHSRSPSHALFLLIKFSTSYLIF